MRPAWILAGAVALALALGACSSNSSSGSSATTAAPAGSTSSGSTMAVVTIEHTPYGSILANSSGRTLYILTSDSATKSTCTGGCASVWPALTVSGTPHGVSGISATMLTTLKRSDGKTQVVFAGHPLYTFSGDTGPHQTNGEGSGGVWFVISSTGTVVKSKTSGGGATTTTGSGGNGY